MTELEAFEKWRKSDKERHQSWKAWQAACKYQREKDAKICMDELHKVRWPAVDISNDCEACAYVILNQVDEGVIEV